MVTMKDPGLFREKGYVNGHWIDADSGKTIDVTNPANDETCVTIPKMGEAETRRAIEAANAALPAWRARTAGERSAILRKWNDLLLENLEDLAVLMTAEQGK